MKPEIKDSPLIFKVNKCISKNSHINLPQSHISANIDDTFCLFKSIRNEYLLIFSHTIDYKNYSLICYDLLHQELITKRINAHKDRIYTCRHYFYKKLKSDLLITSSFDRFIKIWNITNKFALIYRKKPDYNYKENTYLLSENVLFYKKLYIITSAYNLFSEGFKIFFYDISKKRYRRKEIGKFNNSKNNTNFLDVYYEKDIPYILAGNRGNIKVFDFVNQKLIKTFHDDFKNINYLSIIIKENETMKRKNLIATGQDGFLRIWDYDYYFNMLYKIKSCESWLIGLILFDNQYLLATSGDGTLKEYDLYNNKLVASLEKNKNNNDNNIITKNPLFTVKSIEINGNYYLVSHSSTGDIELWKKE